MQEVLKKWGPLVGLLAALWVAGYVIAWLSRYGCGEGVIGRCMVEAAGTALANFLLLEWVDQYQTLLGGMMALAAGGVVWFTAGLQRKHALEDRQADRREKALSNLGMIFNIFTSMMAAIGDNERMTRLIDQLERLTLEIGALDSGLALALEFMVGEIRYGVRSPDSRGDALNTILLGHAFFVHFGRLVDAQGNYVHWPIEKELDNDHTYLRHVMFVRPGGN